MSAAAALLPTRRERLRQFLIRVGALAAKEALHIRRDPRTLYLALVMPVVLLLVFGYGVSFDIGNIPVALVDEDQTQASRELARDFFASRELVQVAEPARIADAETLMRRGQSLGTLVIPLNYQRDLARGGRIPLQLLVDGADGVVANQLLYKAEAIVRSIGQRQLAQAGLSAAPPLQVKVSTRFNPEGRSALFFVPGLVGYLLSIAAVLLTALAIAGEWERGSMEQLFASPVGRLEIILGKLIPYLFIGILQMLLVIAVGAWAFDVPLRGSFALLFIMGMLFLIGMLGQGLLISVLARNQMVATQAGALSSLLPSMLLSGFVFPIENMPRVLQWLSSIIPARYLVHALRGIMLKGNDLKELWPDMLALAIFAFLILALATARFKRRLA